jgi:FtsZ-binding cell division protein ZapB
MARNNEPAFAKHAAELLEKLEARTKTLIDTEAALTAFADAIKQIRTLLAQDGKEADAEELYLKTRATLDRAEISIRSEPLVYQLFALELGYLALILLIGYLAYKWPGPSFWMWSGLVNIHSGAAWYGAVGGATVGLYGLYTHIQARDFDPKYRLWYICKPVMGAIFGWFVFLIYYLGLVSAQGVDTIKTPELPYIIAFLAGFSERFTIKIVDKLMETLTTWQGSDNGKSGSAPTV